MIEIRKPSEVEYNKMKDSLYGFNNFNLENSVFIFNEGKVLGAADFISDQQISILNNSLIFLGQEFLLDGLIKALVNISDCRNNKLFLIKKDENEEFYKKIGFRNLEIEIVFNREKLKETDYLYAKLPEFFQNTCGCGKK